MTPEHFIATPELLHLFSEIQQNASWKRAVALMNGLQVHGFDAPKSECTDFNGDATWEAEFSQAWSHNPKEGALACFSRDGHGRVAMATLTWTMGVNLTSLQAVKAVDDVLTVLKNTLGPVHAVLDQTAEWVSDAGVRSGDEIAASACWAREADKEAGPTLSANEYLAAEMAIKVSIGFRVVLEENASKNWDVIGALSI